MVDTRPCGLSDHYLRNGECLYKLGGSVSVGIFVGT